MRSAVTFIALLVRDRAHAARQICHLLRHAGVGINLIALGVNTAAGASLPALIVGTRSVLTAASDHRLDVHALLICAMALGAMQLLPPWQAAVFASVRVRVDAYASRRLLRAVAESEDALLVERSDVQNAISQANSALEENVYTPGAAAAAWHLLYARYIAFFGAVALIIEPVGVPVALLAVSIGLLNRLGQTITFRAWSRTSRRFAPARQRSRYLLTLLTRPESARDIRALGIGPLLQARYAREALGNLRPIWLARRKIYGEHFVYLAMATVVLTSTLVAVAISSLLAQDTASLANVALVLQVALAAVLFGTAFPECDVFLQYGRVAWEAIVETLHLLRPVGAPSSSSDGGGYVPSTREDSLERGRGAKVEIKSLTFGYEASKPLLTKVSLSLPPGSSTALVGLNGAGKTTLVKLVSGLYLPDSGSIAVDDQVLTPATAQAWRREVAVLFQDFQRYELTLRENLLMASTSSTETDDALYEALELVGLGALAESLPAGLDTTISQLRGAGRGLSGGQWQRLALARALVAVKHGARLLVLDEPTAQLDARGEADFYDRFFSITADATSLIVSHRFSSIRRAQSIAVLSDGGIREQGSHDELLGSHGAYARMYEAQAARFA